MKGRVHVIVHDNKVHYELELNRNFTILRGDSATGKSELVRLVRDFSSDTHVKGIQVICKYPCVAIFEEKREALRKLGELADAVVFIDEDREFLKTQEFADIACGSSCYFVIVTRDDLGMLPYSINEIYELHSSGYYKETKRVYNRMRQI